MDCIWPLIKVGLFLEINNVNMCVNAKYALAIRVRTSKDDDCWYETFHCTHLYVINLVSFKSVLKSALAVMYLSRMYSSNSLCFFCKKRQ